jgi:hypothetical protein
MEQKGVASVRAVADRCDAKYEMVRRVVAGDIIPSRYLFTEICKALNLDEADMEKLWLQDKVELHSGKAGALLSGRNPEMQPIEALWPFLSEEHRRDLVSIAKAFAEHDRATKRKVS